jgi:hypothetical protein
MGGKAKKPEKSSEEVARERLQARQLDKEIGEGEQRFKALARNKLGAKSLLADKAVGADVSAPKSVYGVKPKPKKKITNISDGLA